MSRTIHAVFENGVFRPVEEVDLPEHEEVEITIHEDIPADAIARVAEDSRALEFLSEPREDIYSISDGEPVGPDD